MQAIREERIREIDFPCHLRNLNSSKNIAYMVVERKLYMTTIHCVMSVRPTTLQSTRSGALSVMEVERERFIYLVENVQYTHY